MHSNLLRLPAERARHKKRLPLQGWSDAPPIAPRFTLTGPFTFTQITPINTEDNLPSASLTTPLPSDTNLPSAPAPPSASVTPSVPAAPSVPVQPSAPAGPPAPIASAINPSASATEGAANTGNGIAGVSSTQHGLPTGAIVGITIVCVMLILGAFVFFIRQRSIRNRKLRRQTAPWMGVQPTNSSFEAREVSPFPPGPGAMGEASPGVSFAAAAVASRAPVPNMPQAVPSSYNNPMAVAAPAGATPTALVRYEFIPTLPDELSITTGELVRVLSEYDDGWALCANGRGEQGMVPLECLDRGTARQQLQVVEQQDFRNSRRTSSLGMRY